MGAVRRSALPLAFAGNITETGTGFYRLTPSPPATAPTTVSGHRTEAANEPGSTASQPAGHAGRRIRAALLTELLQLCERSFTTASLTAIAKLITFLVAEGTHPATALGWFTNSLAFAVYHPEPGE